MRVLAVCALVSAAGLFAIGCGGGDPGPKGAGGTGGDEPSETGGSGGSTGGTGGSSPNLDASAKGGTGGSTPIGGSGGGGAGGSSGSGGADASAAEPDASAGADTATAPAGDGPPAGLGGLGPGSADDSPPLVLPGSKLIFDGKTLMGWMPCDPRFWSVKDGVIDGNGSGNNFCLTADDHDTFRLTGKSRMVKDPNNHAGICFWGNRAAGGGGCLQITPVSGSLWDYGGGGGVRTLPRTRDYTKWNFFELLVDLKTGNIDIAVEGQAYPTYKDKDLGKRKKGPIGLQLHANPNEVQYKDLALEDNPTVMKLLTSK